MSELFQGLTHRHVTFVSRSLENKGPKVAKGSRLSSVQARPIDRYLLGSNSEIPGYMTNVVPVPNPKITMAAMP